MHCLVPDQTSEELFAHEVQRSFCNLVTPGFNNLYLTKPEYKIIHRKARLKTKKNEKDFYFCFSITFGALDLLWHGICFPMRP